MRKAKEDRREEGTRLIRADYYDSIRSFAAEALDNVKRGELTTTDDLDRWLHETADGTDWVIYTHKALLVLLASDSWEAYEDEMGGGPEDSGEDSISGLVSTYAFFAVCADIRESPDFEEAARILDGDAP